MNLVVVLVYAGVRGAAPELSGDDLRTLLTSGLVIVLFTVIGVGVGALLRNQVRAIVGSLVHLYDVEPIVASVGALQPAYKWPPGGGVQAVTTDFQAPDLLEPWQGGLLLLGYGLVAALLGTLLAVRRDAVQSREAGSCTGQSVAGGPRRRRGRAVPVFLVPGLPCRTRRRRETSARREPVQSAARPPGDTRGCSHGPFGPIPRA